jgi:hypothetical protein
LKLSRAAIALLAAGCGSASVPGGPRPEAVTPPSAYAGKELTLLVTGQDFQPSVVAMQSGGGVSANAQFRVWLDDPSQPAGGHGRALSPVQWVDARTLRARLPADFPPGRYAVTVEGPFGVSDAKADAFVLSNAQPAQLSASAAAPATVSSDQPFDVSLTLTNGGGSKALRVAPAPLPQAPGVSFSGVDLASGGSHVFTWHLPPQPAGNLVLSLGGTGWDEIDGDALNASASVTVSVIQGAVLVAAPQPGPAVVSVGEALSLDLAVTNAGGTDAASVTVSADLGPALQLVAAPATQDIPAGATRLFTFALAGAASGTALPMMQVQGTDAASGVAVGASTGWTPIVVQVPPALALGAAPLPARASIGQPIQVALTVANGGQATAGAVQTDVQGGAPVALTLAPASSDLAGGASAVYAWQFTAAAAGTATFTATAAGVDANSGAAVSAGPVPLGSVVVETPAALSLSLAAPLQVAQGQTFPVSVTVANAGAAGATGVTPHLMLPSGLQLVSAAPPPQDIAGGGGSATFSFSVNASVIGSISYSASASGADADSGFAVSTQASGAVVVEAPAALRITSFSLPPSLSTGQMFNALLVVQNVGGAVASRVWAQPPRVAGLATLVAPPGPQDIAGGESATFVFAMQAGSSAGSVSLSGSAAGSDADSQAPLSAGPFDSNVATVQAAAQLSATLTIPQSLSRGQSFTAHLVVRNLGDATAHAVLPQSDPPQVVAQVGGAAASSNDDPQVAVDIPGQGSASFEWTFTEDGTSSGSLELQVGAAGFDANSGLAVSAAPSTTAPAAVQEPPSLVVDSLALSPAAAISRGQAFTATLVVRNAGEAAATQVSPAPMPPSVVATGGAKAVTPDSPAPQDIPGGGSVSFVWSFVEDGASSGTLELSGGAAGLDSNSGASAFAAPVQSAPLTVQQPAALWATVAAPGRVDRGQSFAVSVTVTNGGEAAAMNVVPGLAVLPAGAAVLSAPAAATIPGGGMQTFTFALRESGASETALSFSATASGTDANSLAPVSAPPVAATTAVDAPAALSVAAFTLPSVISRGTSVTAQLIVTNTGDATAHNVLPATPNVQTTGGASAFTSTTVAATDLPGHQTASFSWTFAEDGTGPGTLALQTLISATDANSGATISATASAGPVPVQAASQPEVVSFVVPQRLSRGQAFTAVLTVRNTGGTNVNGVSATAPTILATGGAAAVTASAPTIAVLTPGQTGTLSWSYTENGAGSGTLQLSTVVSGTDAVTLQPVSAGASSNAAAVQEAASLSLTSLALPPRIARGQQFQAQLTVRNGGGATATGVTPQPLSLTFSGGAHATVTSPPAPQDIAGGAAATFTWTLTEDGAASGTLSAAAAVTATDANSGAALAPAPIPAGPVPVEQPASLHIVSLSVPATITWGQSFTVTVAVANQGEAAARVVPGSLAISPSGAATVTSVPAAANVAGGSTGSFSFSVASSAGSSATALGFSLPVTGTDLDSGAPLSTGPATASATVQSAPQLVLSSFALRSSSGGTAIDRGEPFTADLVVTNSGQATAVGVSPSPLPLAISATGGAAASTSSSVSAATIAGGQSATFHWSYLETGSSAGTLAVSAGLVGFDANSGAALSAAAGASNTLLVQRPAALSAALSVPSSIGIQTSFTVSLSVSNSGDAAATNVVPSLAVTGTAVVALVSSPAPADVAGGATQIFQWTYTASANGTLFLSAQASGTDAVDGQTRTAQASASTAVTEMALIASDPFGDGSPFGYVFEYSGRVFVGPRANGAGAVSFLPDGSGARSESFLFNTSTTPPDLNTSKGPYASLGYSGCTKDTVQCGPDDENGRADYYAGFLNGTEVLVGLGTRTNDHLRRIYSTTGTASSKTFAPTAFDGVAVDGGSRGVTSMLAVGSRFYIGFAQAGGGARLVFFDQGFIASPPFTNLDVKDIPGFGVGNPAPVQLIDTLAEYNGLLYLANNNGCARSTVAQPQPYNSGLLGGLTGQQNWSSCTPNSIQWTKKISVTTTKTTDFTPADRAVPQTALYQGRLYLARNTTTGPQLWVCNPGADGNCDPADWSLIAPNDTGDTSLSSFDDPNLTAITLLAATAEHLYVGYDGPSGVQVFRATTATPINRADFQGVSGCNAANHPTSCDGLGGAGLGQGVTRIWSDAVMSFAGADYLYLSAGTGTSGARVFRVAQ